MKKVASGQALRIPAATFNTMVDAATEFERRKHNRSTPNVPLDTKHGLVLVRNQSGANRSRFDVLGISNVIVTPTQNAQEFASRFALNVVTANASHSGKFVVLQEPMKNNAFGLALVTGITPVYVSRPSGDTSELAGVKDGQTYLETGASGAQILWEDSGGSTPHLALVRSPATLEGFDYSLIRMKVVTVQGDYLVCQPWTGSAWGSNQNVAKPYLLRTSITSRNGITYSYANNFTRTATQGANTETQVIVPSYYTSGDEIYAAWADYTNVFVSSTELELLDVNVDARAWAKQ